MYHLIIQRHTAPLTPDDIDPLQALAAPAAVEQPADDVARLRDIRRPDPELRRAIDAHCRPRRIDWAIVPAGLRLDDFRLLAMDMDSTLISIETVDEIGGLVGRKEQIAEITAAAMRGEIADYAESLRRRVALLAGVTRAQLDSLYTEILRLNPGAETLLGAARAAGLKTLLVTGGFTEFTDRLQAILPIDRVRANVLGMRDEALDGTLVGAIVDGQGKRQAVLEYCAELGCDPGQVLVIGDGANDLPMMHAAGFSVAYHAKPTVREQASAAIDCGGLDTVLRWFE